MFFHRGLRLHSISGDQQLPDEVNLQADFWVVGAAVDEKHTAVSLHELVQAPELELKRQFKAVVALEQHLLKSGHWDLCLVVKADHDDLLQNLPLKRGNLSCEQAWRDSLVVAVKVVFSEALLASERTKSGFVHEVRV